MFKKKSTSTIYKDEQQCRLYFYKTFLQYRRFEMTKLFVT